MNDRFNRLKAALSGLQPAEVDQIDDHFDNDRINSVDCLIKLCDTLESSIAAAEQYEWLRRSVDDAFSKVSVTDTDQRKMYLHLIGFLDDLKEAKTVPPTFFERGNRFSWHPYHDPRAKVPANARRRYVALTFSLGEVDGETGIRGSYTMVGLHEKRPFLSWNGGSVHRSRFSTWIKNIMNRKAAAAPTDDDDDSEDDDE